MILAIGPDSDLRFDVAMRAYDYTPSVRADGPTWDDEEPGRPGGGANHFLDFIVAQAVPALAARAPLDLRRRALCGTLVGWLFALHALLRRPQFFSRYAATDPSLWWQDGFILREAEHPAPCRRGARPCCCSCRAPRPKARVLPRHLLQVSARRAPNACDASVPPCHRRLAGTWRGDSTAQACVRSTSSFPACLMARCWRHPCRTIGTGCAPVAGLSRKLKKSRFVPHRSRGSLRGPWPHIRPGRPEFGCINHCA